MPRRLALFTTRLPARRTQQLNRFEGRDGRPAIRRTVSLVAGRAHGGGRRLDGGRFAAHFPEFGRQERRRVGIGQPPDDNLVLGPRGRG